MHNFLACLAVEERIYRHSGFRGREVNLLVMIIPRQDLPETTEEHQKTYWEIRTLGHERPYYALTAEESEAILPF